MPFLKDSVRGEYLESSFLAGLSLRHQTQKLKTWTSQDGRWWPLSRWSKYRPSEALSFLNQLPGADPNTAKGNMSNKVVRHVPLVPSEVILQKLEQGQILPLQDNSWPRWLQSQWRHGSLPCCQLWQVDESGLNLQPGLSWHDSDGNINQFIWESISKSDLEAVSSYSISLKVNVTSALKTHELGTPKERLSSLGDVKNL